MELHISPDIQIIFIKTSDTTSSVAMPFSNDILHFTFNTYNIKCIKTCMYSKRVIVNTYLLPNLVFLSYTAYLMFNITIKIRSFVTEALPWLSTSYTLCFHFQVSLNKTCTKLLPLFKCPLYTFVLLTSNTQ